MFILGRGMAPEGKEIVANRTKVQQCLSYIMHVQHVFVEYAHAPGYSPFSTQ